MGIVEFARIPGLRPSRAARSAPDAQRIDCWTRAALGRASVREISDPPGVVATVEGLRGVWAFGSDEREARAELGSVLAEWAALKLSDGDADIPSIDGVSLHATR